MCPSLLLGGRDPDFGGNQVTVTDSTLWWVVGGPLETLHNSQHFGMTHVQPNIGSCPDSFDILATQLGNTQSALGDDSVAFY